MANESAIFWVDVENNTLLTGWDSSTPSQRPSFKQGDNIKVEMHFVRRVSTNTGIFFDEVPTAGSTFRLAVGNPDATPTGGTWSVDFDGEQADFLYNASATAVQTALNAFTSITALGGVTVEKVNGDTTYRIAFNNKIALPDGFSGDGTNLLPSSTVVIDEIKVGSATVRSVWQIKPTQVPIAYQGVWTPQSFSGITATTLQSGTTRVKIAPAPKDGTFVLSVGTYTTAPISVYATALEVYDAITEVVAGFEVKKSGAFIWDVSQSTTPLVAVTANGSGLISFDAVVGEVNFNNYETATLLAGASTKNTTLEIEVTTGTSIATVLQTPCTIIANLINETIFAPTPFEERVSQSDLASGLALKYDASNPAGYIEDAPNDNNQYSRQNNQWQVIELDGNNIPDYDNFVTYAVGSQVYFQGKLYRMVNAAGAAGFDPVGHPSYWESLSGSNPDLSGYAQLSGASFTGVVSAPEIRNPLGTDLVIDSYNNSGLGVHYEHKFTHLDGKFVLATNGGGLTFPDGTTQTTSALPLSGGTMNANAIITLSDASYNADSELAGWGLGIEKTDDHTKYATIEYNAVTVQDGANYVQVTADGVRFNDGTTQTTSAVTPDLSGYALLSGATFTGKVNTTPTSTLAALNLGSQQTAPSSTVAGDLWIGSNINYKSWDGVTKAVANTNTTNSFLQPQVIAPPSSSTTAALRITNTGTGESLRVEDEANPDSTPFVVGADGRVGIHSTPSATASNKLTINGGYLNFTTSGGIRFSDGTQIVAAPNFFSLAQTNFGTGGSNFEHGDMVRVGVYSVGGVPTRYAEEGKNYGWIFPFSNTDSRVSSDQLQMTGSGSLDDGLGNQIPYTATLTIAFQKFHPRLSTGDVIVNFGLAGSSPTFVFTDKAASKGIVSGFEYWGDILTITIPDDVSSNGATYEDTAQGISISLSYDFGGSSFAINPSSANWNSLNVRYEQSVRRATKTDEFVTRQTLMDSFIQELNRRSAFSFPLTVDDANLKYFLRWDTKSGRFKFDEFSALTADFTRLSVSQTFTQPQIISTSSSSTALRVIQQGTGACLTVEDTAGDISLFIVHTDGRVGVNINPSTTFVTGSLFQVQGRASFNPLDASRAPINIGFINGNPTVTQSGDIWINNTTRNLSFNTNSTNYAVPNLGTQNTFTASVATGSGYLQQIANTDGTTGGTLEVRNIQTANTGTNANFLYAGLGSNVVIRSTSTGANQAALRITQLGTGHALVVEDSATPDASSFIVSNAGIVGIGVSPSTWTPTTGNSLEVVGGKAVFTPSTTTAAINIGSGTADPTATTTGDIWIGTNTLNFKDSTNSHRTAANLNTVNTFSTPQIIQAPTSAALPALRISNSATTAGVHSMVVGDAANPDTSSFVIDQNGSVGVGVDPATWTGTHKVEVEGAVKAQSITFDGTAQFKVNAVQSHTGGSDSHELLISYNGSTYKVGMTLVSTP